MRALAAEGMRACDAFVLEASMDRSALSKIRRGECRNDPDMDRFGLGRRSCGDCRRVSCKRADELC